MPKTTDGTSMNGASQKIPAWQAHRLRLLHEAWKAVASARAAGISTAKAIRQAARRRNGRSLGNGKHLQLSVKTLERFWYGKGKNPNIFTLRYRPHAPKRLSPYLLRSIATLAIRDGLNVGQAYERYGGQGNLAFSCRSLRRVLPATINIISRRQRALDILKRKALEDLNHEEKD